MATAAASSMTRVGSGSGSGSGSDYSNGINGGGGGAHDEHATHATSNSSTRVSGNLGDHGMSGSEAAVGTMSSAAELLESMRVMYDDISARSTAMREFATSMSSIPVAEPLEPEARVSYYRTIEAKDLILEQVKSEFQTIRSEFQSLVRRLMSIVRTRAEILAAQRDLVKQQQQQQQQQNQQHNSAKASIPIASTEDMATMHSKLEQLQALLKTYHQLIADCESFLRSRGSVSASAASFEIPDAMGAPRSKSLPLQHQYQQAEQQPPQAASPSPSPPPAATSASSAAAVATSPKQQQQQQQQQRQQPADSATSPVQRVSSLPTPSSNSPSPGTLPGSPMPPHHQPAAAQQAAAGPAPPHQWHGQGGANGPRKPLRASAKQQRTKYKSRILEASEIVKSLDPESFEPVSADEQIEESAKTIRIVTTVPNPGHRPLARGAPGAARVPPTDAALLAPAPAVPAPAPPRQAAGAAASAEPLGSRGRGAPSPGASAPKAAAAATTAAAVPYSMTPPNPAPAPPTHPAPAAPSLTRTPTPMPSSQEWHSGSSGAHAHAPFGEIPTATAPIPADHFRVAVSIPTTEGCSLCYFFFHKSTTVDGLKHAIFSLKLPQLNPRLFNVGIDEEHIFMVEFSRVLLCLPEYTEGVTECVRLSFFTKSFSQRLSQLDFAKFTENKPYLAPSSGSTARATTNAPPNRLTSRAQFNTYNPTSNSASLLQDAPPAATPAPAAPTRAAPTTPPPSVPAPAVPAAAAAPGSPAGTRPERPKRKAPDQFAAAIVLANGDVRVLNVPMSITANGLVTFARSTMKDLFDATGPDSVLYTVRNGVLSPFEGEQVLYETPYVSEHAAMSKVPVFSIGKRSIIRAQGPSPFKPGAKIPNGKIAPARSRTFQSPLGARAALSLASSDMPDSNGAAETGTSSTPTRPPRAISPAPRTMPENRATVNVTRTTASPSISISSDGTATRDEDVIITDFVLPSGMKLTLPCSTKATVETVKQILWQRLKREERKSRTLRYYLKVTGTSYFVPEGDTPFGQLPIVAFCRKKGIAPMFSLIDKEKSREEKLISKKIRTMVEAAHLDDTIDDNDASDFRIKVSRLLGDRETKFVPGMAAVLAEGPIDPAAPTAFPITVFIVASQNSTSKTIQFSGSTTCAEVIAAACKKTERVHNESLDPKQYTLKISGEAKYICDLSIRLDRLAYVRYCLQRKQRISFTVISKSQAPQMNAEGRDTLGEIDWMSNLSGSQESSPFDETTVEMHGDNSTVSLLELTSFFEIKISSVEGLTKVESGVSVVVEVLVYHGSECIASPLYTAPRTPSGANKILRWNQWLRSDLRICNIPEQTRVCITVYAKKGRDVPLAHVNCCLFDFKNHFRSGELVLNMWPDAKANPIGTCVQNLRPPTADSGPPARIRLAFPTFPQPVVFPNIPAAAVATRDRAPVPNDQTRARLETLVDYDQLHRLSPDDKILLWQYREYCRHHLKPRALVKVLSCVNWKDIECVKETYRLLNCWRELEPVDALELLDAKFADRKIRETAVRFLDRLNDFELNDYLLQLVQVLKYEPKHFSALACWLLRRALQNRMLIGNAFFWHLQAEMHVPEISERYGLLLEMYLRGCGEQRDELMRQLDLVKKLRLVANSIKDVPLNRRRAVLQQRLKELPLPERYQLPLDPCRFASTLAIERCKSMDSAKAPLWLVFDNAEENGDQIWLIFKSGDDLRQDLLTLQMLGIMDKLWKKEGLDLCLTPYRCVATGDEMGMIETVLHSETTANIQKKAGGVTGAFKQTPLANWLIERNENNYDAAVENFTRSCAGYCVATYVLGIGDRHNDNIMVNKDGFLFHIDFGHFLGNYKTWGGIKRERAPFILTPEFANVMGGKKGENFKRFIDLCCEGYNILRKHANVFINLFAMMLSTGIPELQSEEDIEYLREALELDLSDEDAKDHFLKLIYESLKTIATQINFAIHIFAHS